MLALDERDVPTAVGQRVRERVPALTGADHDRVVFHARLPSVRNTAEYTLDVREGVARDRRYEESVELDYFSSSFQTPCQSSGGFAMSSSQRAAYIFDGLSCGLSRSASLKALIAPSQRASR